MKPRAYPVLIAVLGLFLFAACNGDSATSTPTPTSTAAGTITDQVQNTEIPAAEIVAALTPSVVHIQTEAMQLDMINQPVPAGGVGTGEIIDVKGYILTNNHVIDGAQRIVVTLSDGRSFEAELIGGDAALDLAVLRIEAEGLVVIPMGDSSKLRVGDMVIAIGHALNLPGGPTITGGWVSALERAIDISPTVTMQHLVQTDAAINPGNSGGPLVNGNGEMVAINTAKLPAGEGIGFSIAIDPVMPLIQEIIETGKIDRGFFGATVTNVNDALAMNFDLPVNTGVLVTSVAPGSPAAEVGLQISDIIIGAEDTPVNNQTEFDAVLIRYRVGSDVDLEFIRGDKRVEVTVTLGERPN